MTVSYPEKDVRIKDIYLANDNPRHDPLDSEPEIIEHMLKDHQVRELAKSIISLGSVNPIDLMAVIPHPKQGKAYMVAEGNRRLTALKLLIDPELAPKENDRKFFRKLAASGVKIDTIRVVVFPNKKAVEPWMYIKHLGAQGGAGTKNWDASSKIRADRNYGTTDSAANQSLLLVEYAQENGLIDSAKDIPITTIKRFLSNPIFRNSLSLVDNKSLTIQSPKDQFDRVVGKFLNDSLDSTSEVNSRTNKQDRINYANKLIDQEIAPTDKVKEPFDVYAGNGKPGGKKRPRNSPNPKDRHNVVDQKFRVKIDDPILNRLYHELRDLNADRYTYSATYVLRAFIEKTIVEYLKAKKVNPIPKKLHQKMLKAAECLQSDGLTERQTKYLRQMATNFDADYSPDSIGHAIHGGSVPKVSTLVGIWDSISAVVLEMLEQVRKVAK